MSTGTICSWYEASSTVIDWRTEEDEENWELVDEVDNAAAAIDDGCDDGEQRASTTDTLDRAKDFLAVQMKGLKGQFNRTAPVPSIELGPSGSIDVHWKRTKWELLINFPADVRQPATYYADNYGARSSKGSLEQKSTKLDLGIAMWLMQG